MESIYYKGKRVGNCHMYVSLSPTYSNKNVGRICFEGLDALVKILTAPNEDEISCAYWVKETIKDLKRRLEEEYFAIYLSFESERIHEEGIKARIDDYYEVTD